MRRTCLRVKDASLKRCYGKDKLVANCDWDYLSTIHTLAAPHEPMPRLVDLLGFLTRPECRDIWVLLDIKMDDDPTVMIKSISEAIAAAPKSPSAPWSKRVVLGIWAIKYLAPCATYLPDYALSNIGFSTIVSGICCYEAQFLILATVCSKILDAKDPQCYFQHVLLYSHDADIRTKIYRRCSSKW